MLELTKRIWLLCYEGDGDGDGDGDGGDKGGGGGDGGGGGGGDQTTFSQEDLNRFLAKEKRKHQETLNKTLEEFNALKAKATLSDEERSGFEDRISRLTNTQKTVEEKYKEQIAKLTQDHQTEKEMLSGERDRWRGDYTNQVIDTAITQAAAQEKAFNPAHLIAILKPQTELVEALDDEGKPTGRYTAQVKFNDMKEGKPVTLELTIPEAVKRMADKDEYLYLFEGKGKGGMGDRNRGGGGTGELDWADLARTNPAKYRELRNKGKMPE